MKNKSFDKAYSELQKISDLLQQDDISIDKLSTHIKKASELVRFCKDKLRTISEEIDGIEEE